MVTGDGTRSITAHAGARSMVDQRGRPRDAANSVARQASKKKKPEGENHLRPASFGTGLEGALVLTAGPNILADLVEASSLN